MKATIKTIVLPKYPVTEFIVHGSYVCQVYDNKIQKERICKNHEEAEKVRDQWVNKFWGFRTN